MFPWFLTSSFASSGWCFNWRQLCIEVWGFRPSLMNLSHLGYWAAFADRRSGVKWGYGLTCDVVFWLWWTSHFPLSVMTADTSWEISLVNVSTFHSQTQRTRYSKNGVSSEQVSISILYCIGELWCIAERSDQLRIGFDTRQIQVNVRSERIAAHGSAKLYT